MRHSLALCLLAAAILAPRPAPAADVLPGDVGAGRELADRWCTACHVTEGLSKGTDAAPTFRFIANRKDRTAGEMEAWLVDPHPVMPDLKLSRTQIDDLIAYIESLKDE
ncbi:MAG: cytochrome c [Rhodospirillaceae bacterium]|jgi:cytochrome c|nr:cytochrome c [Rhodospirillaceae bacterium]